jgi:hypothetical protein
MMPELGTRCRRFVFLPLHRQWLAKEGLPKQNGVTHFEAGDIRAQEVRAPPANCAARQPTARTAAAAAAAA